MKFFRSIRQTLVKEGKLKKYLLYAIGEILLVMIGITLAFQVSNWGDNQIKKAAEIKYYQNIRDQIAGDKALIMHQIAYNNRHMAQFAFANEIIENNDRSKMDTLGTIVLNLTNYSAFDRQSNIYETMVNSGEIKLLQNDNIINGTRELEAILLYIDRMENIHHEAMMSYAAPNVLTAVKWSTGKIQEPDIVYSFKFQNLILVLIQIMVEKDDTYNQALKEIDRLTALIDKELMVE
jgi:hypothetical protein